MLKKLNKSIYLLVAVASVISLIPRSANAATKETKSQEGDIYSAVAYKDGNFYIGGQPYKKDEAAYYLSNGQYKQLDDIDSEDKVAAYGTKYVEAGDGDYYLDLSNGKVSDDEVKNKDLDNVGVNLRSKIKYDNDERYDDTDANEIKTVTEIPKAKFVEGWYAAQYKIKSASDTINGGVSTFNVYTDNSGKYIDADYNLGKIKVKLSDGKTATVENTSDANNYVRGAVSDAIVIGQDSDNIYRLATITVKSTNGATISEINGVAISDSTTSFSLSSDKESVSFKVIQVISKDQSSKNINGIKYAKNVTNYVLSDKDGKKVDLLSGDQKAFTVTDGKLINYEIEGTKLKASVVELKNKNSIYYVDLGSDDDVTLQDQENSVDIDSKGNLWALSDDAILRFDNDGNFDEVYGTDEEYNDLSVYDQDNIVVWNSNDEIYSIISKKTSSDDENKNTNTTTTNTNAGSNNSSVKAGWSLENGSWSYNNSDGSKFKGWLNANGTWYYLDANGSMVTGWKCVNGEWYYLNSSGTMKTGWLNDNGAWYYLNASGVMLSNTTVNGYKLSTNGAWIN